MLTAETEALLAELETLPADWDAGMWCYRDDNGMHIENVGTGPVPTETTEHIRALLRTYEIPPPTDLTPISGQDGEGATVSIEWHNTSPDILLDVTAEPRGFRDPILILRYHGDARRSFPIDGPIRPTTVAAWVMAVMQEG